MKVLIGAMFAVVLSGCSITEEIPSFYDDNESKQIINVVMAVDSLDCSSHFVNNQLDTIQYEYAWLKAYSRAKGSVDIIELIEPFENTLAGIVSKKTLNVNYCRLKRDSLYKQSTRIADAIMGRY